MKFNLWKGVVARNAFKLVFSELYIISCLMILTTSIGHILKYLNFLLGLAIRIQNPSNFLIQNPNPESIILLADLDC